MTAGAPALAERVAAAEALARTPGAEVYLDPADVDYEAWNHIGDPLCEDLLGVMRERKLMGGDIYANARALEADGVAEAVAFFADAEAIPSWLDLDALRAGASMGKRHPVGLLVGVHSALPYTYIDPATVEVMGATGRLARGGDFGRRYWETATGFIGALDVDGMMPGGERWIQWVRIRFLHTMIRTGIRRGGRWTLGDQGTPVSMLATAASDFIFGQHRVRIIEYMGGVVTREEREGFSLMWRWISRIEGANNQLLGRTHSEDFELMSRSHQFLYRRTDGAARMTGDVVTGTAGMRTFGRSRRLNRALMRQLLGPALTETLPGYDVRGDLGLEPDPLAELAVKAGAGLLRLLNQLTRLKPVRRLADRRGQEFLDYVVGRGLDGVRATYRGTPVAGQPTDR